MANVTLLDSIDTEKENILNVSNLESYTIIDDFKIPVSNLFRNKYRDYILTLCTEVEIKEELMDTYRYQPKKFSLDLYGTIELWHLILWVNNMISIREFTQRKIKVLDPANLNKLYRLISKEEEYLNKESEIIKTK